MAETRLQEVLAVVNNKGGVGKTTTVQSLASVMKRLKPSLRILVVDLDPQADLTKLMGWNSGLGGQPTVTDALAGEEGRLPVYKSECGVYYVPASAELQRIEPRLMEQMQPYLVLRKLLLKEVKDCCGEGVATIPESFDYVLIDCPPALSMLTYNAMAVANGLLIPVQMEGLSVAGLAPVIVEMERVKRELNPQLDLRGILPVMVDSRPNISRSFMAYLEKAYGDRITTTVIPRSVRVNEAQTRKQDVIRYMEQNPVAVAYRNLAIELFS